MMSSYAISKFIVTSILVISFVKCDKPATPGPVYSYYAPHPTTAATTTTTTLPPPPPAPYDPYYDSYYSPYTAPASGNVILSSGPGFSSFFDNFFAIFDNFSMRSALKALRNI